MEPGYNGPPIPNGGSNNYDRAVCFDAPVAMDTGLYVRPEQTLGQLRRRLLVRLGYAAQADNPAPGIADELTDILQDAQQQLYLRYSDLHTERWWAWQLLPGQRVYDTPIDCTKSLDFRKITGAWLADNGGVALQTWQASTPYTLGQMLLAATYNGELWFEVTTAGTTGASEPAWPSAVGGTVVDGTVTFTARQAGTQTWMPIRQGINPLDYGSPSSGIPTHFDLREYIEVWPAADKPMVLWLKGHLGIKRFTDDDDLPTIDSNVLFLFALALAKSGRGHEDANNYAQMATAAVAKIVAAGHGIRRYIPRPSTAGLKLDTYGDEFYPCALPRATWR